MRFLVPFAFFVLAGCPLPDGLVDAGPNEDGEDAGRTVDAGSDRDAGFPDVSDCALFQLDDTDIGTHCGGAVVDEPLAGSVGIALAVLDPLPQGLALTGDEDGWRVQGTAPAVDAPVDVSFVLAATALDCQATLRVGMILDPCDGGDGTCGPFATPHPIAGFCLPTIIDADTAFSVATLTSSCLGSTCSEVRPALCAVSVDGARVTVGGDACVRQTQEGSCSEDCQGGDGAPCSVPPLPPGDYVMASSSGELAFPVPFTAAPDDELCVYAF